MEKKPLVSIIIIDYKKENPYRTECLEAIQEQTYKNYEIILVTDHPVTLPYPATIKKSFGHYVGPAQKRDWGAKKASGEILAFIDDDAYPDKDWLKNIVKDLSDSTLAGVGGPGVTPPNVSWTEEASGWMSASPLGAGINTYRFFPSLRKFVDDYPSMNLAIRRSDFLAVGGYDSNYWPGEDTKLCLDIVTKLKKKIIYDPEVLVYHHRRPLWKPHLRQNGSFGLHRGFFARVLPQTSRKLIYFMPSLLLLGLIFIIFFPAAIYCFLLYFVALFLNGFWIFRKSGKITQAVLSIPVVFLTHLWYGARFLQGFFFTNKLTR